MTDVVVARSPAIFSVANEASTSLSSVQLPVEAPWVQSFEHTYSRLRSTQDAAC